MMDLHPGFWTLYTCELAEPGSIAPPETHYFGPNSEAEARAREGMLVDVWPHGAPPWRGRFQFGDIRLSRYDAIPSHPAPKLLCVVARGNGYMVDTWNPSMWELAAVFPITAAIPVVERGLLLLADPTAIVAYGAAGLVWKTARLAWDGFSITKVDDQYAWGVYEDPSGEARRFRVDLATGERTGDPVP